MINAVRLNITAGSHIFKAINEKNTAGIYFLGFGLTLQVIWRI